MPSKTERAIDCEVAGLRLPTLISIKVRLGRNGGSTPADALSELFRKKPGETEVRFRLSVPANGDAVLTYTVQAES